MKNIVWVSRHTPMESQVDELTSHYGEVEIIRVTGTVENIDDVLGIVTGDTVAVIAVLPIKLLSKLVKKSPVPVLKPLLNFGRQSDGTDIATHRGFIVVEQLEYKSSKLEKDDGVDND